MIMRRSEPSEKDELKQLWKVCFDEDEDFLDEFFNLRVKSQDVFVVQEDNMIVSALYVLPMKIVLDNAIEDVRYLVGGCTLEAYRNRGYFGTLIRSVSNQTSQLVLFFPESRPFYIAKGFFNVSFVNEYEVEPLDEIVSEQGILDITKMDMIYRKCLMRSKSGLLRDEISWRFLLSDPDIRTIFFDEDEYLAYAFIKKEVAFEVAFEVVARDLNSAKHIVFELRRRGVQKIRAIKGSYVDKTLKDNKCSLVYLGMSNREVHKNIYVPEVY